MKKIIRVCLLPVLFLLLLFLLSAGTAGRTEARFRTEKEIMLPEVSLIPKVITVPLPVLAEDLVYDGLSQDPGLVLPEGVTVSGTTEAVRAGTYTLTLHLPENSGKVWPDGTAGDRSLSWSIGKRYLVPPYLTGEVQIFDGGLRSPVIHEPAPEYVRQTGTASASAAGTYNVDFTLKDPESTCWSDGSTGTVRRSWRICVCHIGDIYYTSTTAALDSDRSTESLPIVMDCDYAFASVNTGGTDYLDLNGRTLSDSISNRGTLTVYNGTVTKTGSGNAYALRNSGNLYVLSGSYTGICTASADAGVESYGLYNTAGTAVISPGVELRAYGDQVAVCGVNIEGGSVVSEAEVIASNNVSSHGAYYCYLNGGSLTVNGGTSLVTNPGGFGHLIQAAGGTVIFNGGTHVCRYNGNATIFLATGGAITVNGGTTDLSTTGSTNAACVSAGSLRLYGGTHTAVTTGVCDSHGILRSDGTALLQGAVIRVGTAGMGYGAANMTADPSRTAVQLRSGSIYVRAASACCVCGVPANAWIDLSGEVGFYIYYRDSHTCGQYYCGSAPVHRVLTTTSAFSYRLSAVRAAASLSRQSEANGSELSLEVTGSCLYVGGASVAQGLLTLPDPVPGLWKCEWTGEEGRVTGLRLSVSDDPAYEEQLELPGTEGLTVFLQKPPEEYTIHAARPCRMYGMRFVYRELLDCRCRVYVPETESYVTGICAPLSAAGRRVILEYDALGQLTGIRAGEMKKDPSEEEESGAYSNTG